MNNNLEYVVQSATTEQLKIEANKNLKISIKVKA